MVNLLDPHPPPSYNAWFSLQDYLLQNLITMQRQPAQPAHSQRTAVSLANLFSLSISFISSGSWPLSNSVSLKSRSRRMFLRPEQVQTSCWRSRNVHVYAWRRLSLRTVVRKRIPCVQRELPPLNVFLLSPALTATLMRNSTFRGLIGTTPGPVPLELTHAFG